MSVEQKRVELEKALEALNEKEIEEIAGGMGDKGKKILKYVGAGAGVIAGAAALGMGGKILYDKYGKKKTSDDEEHTN